MFKKHELHPIKARILGILLKICREKWERILSRKKQVKKIRGLTWKADNVTFQGEC